MKKKLKTEQLKQFCACDQCGKSFAALSISPAFSFPPRLSSLPARAFSPLSLHLSPSLPISLSPFYIDLHVDIVNITFLFHSGTTFYLFGECYFHLFFFPFCSLFWREGVMSSHPCSCLFLNASTYCVKEGRYKNNLYNYYFAKGREL